MGKATRTHELTDSVIEQDIDVPELKDEAEVNGVDEAWDVLKSKLASQTSGGKKFYYFDPRLEDPRTWPTDYAKAFNGTRPQVKGIIAWMAKHALGEVNARQGKDIVAGAKSEGYVKSKIDDAVLFAYYARKIEQLGVRHA
jgi:hypothetical protein